MWAERTAIVWSVIISVCLFARSFPVEQRKGVSMAAVCCCSRWYSLCLMTNKAALSVFVCARFSASGQTLIDSPMYKPLVVLMHQSVEL